MRAIRRAFFNNPDGKKGVYGVRDWLRQQRLQLQKTQRDVAQEANIARSYYTRIERGDYKIPVDTAKRIAEVLDFDWQHFYEEPFAQERSEH